MRYIALLTILFFPLSANAQNVQERIDKLQGTHKKLKLERVIDGDTIDASGKTIRLWGIDAPEPNTEKGPVATQFLKAFIKDATLKCKFIEKDQYQRHVMHCLSDGSDIGSIMVQMGMARDFSRYSGDYYDYEERNARQSGRGIWQ